jgi:hypothetical protein
MLILLEYTTVRIIAYVEINRLNISRNSQYLYTNILEDYNLCVMLDSLTLNITQTLILESQ